MLARSHYLPKKNTHQHFQLLQMTELNQYLDNPYWMGFYRYAMGPPNGGYYKRWVQGSPGMMEPMPLYSNEYSHLYMKHGQNDLLAYRGGIKRFAPSVNGNLQAQVHQCNSDTLNPAGCADAAVRKVYSKDAHRQGPSFTGRTPVTPHPFDVSYETGRSPHMAWIPPTHHYQD